MSTSQVHSVYLCQFLWLKGIASDTISSLPVSTDECRTAHELKGWKGQQLTEHFSGFWTTNHTLQVEFSWCCIDHCYTVENFVLQSGDIATTDGHHLTSNLDDVHGCQIMDGSCAHSEAVVIWTVQNSSQAFCAYEFKGTEYDYRV